MIYYELIFSMTRVLWSGLVVFRTILDKIMWTSVPKYVRNAFSLINRTPIPPEQYWYNDFYL